MVQRQALLIERSRAVGFAQPVRDKTQVDDAERYALGILRPAI